MFVNYQRISNPIYIKIKKIISRDKSKFNIDVEYSKGLFNNGSHFLNLILFLFGSFKKITQFKKKKKGNDFLVDFQLKKKNIIINFKHSNMNSISIKSKNFYFNYGGYRQEFYYKRKKIFSNKELKFFFNEKIQFFVINNLEKFILNKKNFYLSDNKKAFDTELLIKKIINA